MRIRAVYSLIRPRRLRTRYKEIQKEEEQIAKDLKQYETKDADYP